MTKIKVQHITGEEEPDDMVCPYCCSENINMCGDPEYNDEWGCYDCEQVFGSWVERKDFKGAL
jgi:hypothetical protein